MYVFERVKEKELQRTALKKNAFITSLGSLKLVNLSERPSFVAVDYAKMSVCRGNVRRKILTNTRTVEPIAILRHRCQIERKLLEQRKRQVNRTLNYRTQGKRHKIATCFKISNMQAYAGKQINTCTSIQLPGKCCIIYNAAYIYSFRPCNHCHSVLSYHRKRSADYRRGKQNHVLLGQIITGPIRFLDGVVFIEQSD